MSSSCRRVSAWEETNGSRFFSNREASTSLRPVGVCVCACGPVLSFFNTTLSDHQKLCDHQRRPVDIHPDIAAGEDEVWVATWADFSQKRSDPWSSKHCLWNDSCKNFFPITTFFHLHSCFEKFPQNKGRCFHDFFFFYSKFRERHHKENCLGTRSDFAIQCFAVAY